MAKIEMTEDQIANLVSAAVKAATEAVMARMAATPPVSPDQSFQALVDARKGKDNPPLPERTVDGIISDTGATFTARIDHRDRVVELINYVHPDGVDTPVGEGGLVPSGMVIAAKGDNSKGELHRQWKWENWWQADINTFVGKPLPPHKLAEAERRKAATA